MGITKLIRSLVLLFSLSAALFLPSTINACAYADSAGPIKVGVISGLTGIAAKWNKLQNLGMLLAQEELAKTGRPIELIFEDSKSNSAAAIAAFNKLLDLDKVDAIVADDFGFVIAPIIPLTAQRKKLFLAISVPHERYCAIAPGFFYSATSQFPLTRSSFERFFDAHPEVRRIALITFDDPNWGAVYRASWLQIVASRGIKVVADVQSGETLPDFKSILTKILPKKPEALFVAHEPNSFYKAVRQLHYRGYIVSANNVLEMLTDEGVDSRPVLEGSYTVDPRVSEDFVRKFQTRFHRLPILEAYSGYEAIRILAAAFKVNSRDPAEGMKHVAYDGVAGKIDFTGSSCLGNFANWGLFRFQEGALQEVLPAPKTTAATLQER